MKRLITFTAIIIFSISLFAQNQVDANGKQHGLWKKYNKDTLKYEGTFNHGIPEGEFIYYYSANKIKAKTVYSQNGNIAETIMYFANGGKMAEGKYVNKKREGKWINYDGFDNIIGNVNYVNGKKDGICQYFYSDGNKLEEISFKNGIEDGDFRQYFQDGNIKAKGSYKNGKYDGIFVYYNPNNIVYNTGKYENNKKVGDWTLFDELGKPIVKTTYKNGFEVNRIVYQKNKDPEKINNDMSKEEINKRGTGTTDNGINDPRYEGY